MEIVFSETQKEEKKRGKKIFSSKMKLKIFLSIPRLASAFSDLSFREQTRMKIGEALLQVLLVQGDAIVQHMTPVVLNAVLGGARDSNNAGVRSSAISILSSLLGALPPAFVDTLSIEISTALIAIIRTDQDNQVRRACAVCIASLCLILNRDITTHLSNSQVIASIASSISVVHGTDSDDIVREHCSTILSDLDLF